MSTLKLYCPQIIQKCHPTGLFMPTKGCLATSGMTRFAWPCYLKCGIKVTVITIIKGRAFESDPGLRCLQTKTLSGVQKAAGFPEGLHSGSRIYGFFLSPVVVIVLSCCCFPSLFFAVPLAGASLLGAGGTVTCLPNEMPKIY